MKLKEQKQISPDFELSQFIEEQLSQAHHRRETALHQRIRLLSNMSRSIRSRLNAIIGLSELLTDGMLSEEQNEYVRSIHEAGNTVVSQINNVLEYLKIEQGKATLEIRQYSLEQLLEEIDSVMRPQAEKKGLEFNIIRYGCLPANIRTDTTHLRQCLLQLAENAIMFTKKEPVYIKVYLESGEGKAYLRFDFEKGGPDLNEEKKKAIFAPVIEASENTGWFDNDALAELIITNQLAKLLGGRLSVRSENEQSSVFSLLIPTDVSTKSQSLADDSEIIKQEPQTEEKEINKLLSGIAGAHGRILSNKGAATKGNITFDPSSSRQHDKNT